jgi:hypothetical protein
MRALVQPLIGASFCSSLFAAVVAAQCVEVPLPTSASTRGLAMGNANLAGRDDDVLFYGPAQLAVARGTSVAAERYVDGLASGDDLAPREWRHWRRCTDRRGKELGIVSPAACVA